MIEDFLLYHFVKRKHHYGQKTTAGDGRKIHCLCVNSSVNNNRKESKQFSGYADQVEKREHQGLTAVGQSPTPKPHYLFGFPY